MKKIILILTILLLASTSNAFAGKCLKGAVFDVDENGQAQLVDCAKWERSPEAVLAEQQAINNYTNEDLGNFTVESAKFDETPALGKAQDRINDTWHSIYQSIFN